MPSTAQPLVGHDRGVRAPFLVLAVGLAFAAACGGRTSLERTLGGPSSETDASDEPAPDASEDGSDEGFTYCDPRLGPLRPGEVPGGSFYRRCDATFPHCVDVAGQWACCHGPGPYDGPTGSCIF